MLIALAVLQIIVNALLLVTLYGLRNHQREYHKAYRQLLDHLVVRITQLEIEKEHEHGTGNPSACRSDGESQG